MFAMDLSRRQFLQLSSGTGTALGTLAGLGISLTLATTHAQYLRIQNAQVTPSVCPYCSVGWPRWSIRLTTKSSTLRATHAVHTTNAPSAPKAPPSTSCT